MHVLLIHQAFVGPQEPGGTRHYELAQQMRAHGYQCSIVASDISYLSGQSVVQKTGLVSEQDCNGVRVLRAYTYPALHRSFVWRVVSFVSFMCTSVWAGLRAGPVDVVMGTSPPIFQAVSAWLVALLRRKPFLLEIRDLWPEFAIDMGVLKNPLLIALSRWLEGFLYARATHLLVNSPAYRAYLINKGTPASKVSLIPNGVDPDMFTPEADGNAIRQRWQLGDRFVVTYAGALGIANDIPVMLQAAEQLRDDDHIRFLIVGDGKERAALEAQAQQMGLSNVLFTGPQPKSEMPAVLAASDACIAILQNIQLFRTTYPNKVFDYMAAGRPTLLAIDGVIRDVIDAAHGGVFVPPGNAAALAEAVLSLSRNRAQARAMGTSARTYVVEHFNRQRQAEHFVNLMQDVAQMNDRRSSSRRLSKRIFDLALTVPALVLLSPLLLVIALLVRFKLGSPVLFCQQRPGLHGKPFTIYKFRTMTDTRDAQGNLLPDSERLPAFGRLLRSTSLDELPELFNVLTGDMSVVGPRPLLMQYLDRYTPEQKRRHEVMPGITGWAQVNGRNALSWPEKFALEVWYVDHGSLWLDVKILCLTVAKIFQREGINQPGHATAQEFKGNS
ncbi:MAG: glycosyltransferase [Deltaproteobacteria bacterium]|nr:glycosyltransferase [Deltaproteobacteria bacterium]